MTATIGKPRERIGRSQRNLDLVARARTLTDTARAYRRSKREEVWRLAERQWAGYQWGDELPIDQTHDLVTVNMSFSTVNTILPYVTGADPSFVVEPYGGKATPQNARLIQAWLNREWRSNRLAGNQHLRRAAFDFLVAGDGYLKTSYTLDTVLKEGGYSEAEVARLWVDRLDPRDVWIDPHADGIHNARFVVVRVFRSVEELQADKRFRNTASLEASDDRSLEVGRERRDAPAGDQTGHDRDKMVAVYEFYDLTARQLVVWCEQAELPLRVVDDIDCPVVQIGNHIIPDCPYHMGELEQLVSLQQELNKTRTQMVEHRRRNAQKWLVRRGVLDDAAQSALKSEDVNSVVEVAGDHPIADAVAPLQVANLSADAYAIDQLIKGDMNEVSGVNEYLRGSAAAIRRTATEATIIEGSTNVKTAAKLRVIEAAARQVGQMLLNMAAAIYPLTDADEMTMILTGRDAQAVVAAEEPKADLNLLTGAKINPTGLFVGSYEVFVEQGSTELRNPAAQERKYADMIGLMLTLMQAGVPINIRKVIELYLEAAGVDDIDAVLASPELQTPDQPGTPYGGPGYAGGLAGLATSAGAPNPVSATPPAAFPSPENSGMMPPTS